MFIVSSLVKMLELASKVERAAAGVGLCISLTLYCHMGTAIKHPVPGRVKPSFVIFDIRHSEAQLGCQKLQMTA